MLTKYKVREGFTMHRKSGSIHHANEIVELDDVEAQNHINQLEEVQVEEARAAAGRKRRGEESGE